MPTPEPHTGHHVESQPRDGQRVAQRPPGPARRRRSPRSGPRAQPPIGKDQSQGRAEHLLCAPPNSQFSSLAAGPNRGSFARLPPAPTTLCYLRLSAATAMGLLSVASVAGRPSPGRAALNELSAPALTIHDVPNRGRRGRPYACHLPARPTAYEGTGAPRSFVTTSRLWGSAQGREATPGHKVRLATTRVEDRPGPSLTRSTCARLWNRRLIARIWSLRRARTGLQVRNFCEMDAGL